MRKIIKVNTKVTIIFEDGSYCERDGVSKEDFEKILNAQSDEEIYCMLYPEYGAKKKEYDDAVDIINGVNKSNLLTKKGGSIYWMEISNLSIPFEFAKAILEAETQKDEIKLDTYKNFWTLMSLNPDERCRKNLFWFLNKNGLVISRCGFFVAYRNVNLKTIDAEGVEIYTDAHTGTFSIKIGEVVTMPREECDSTQENTCSRGLHLGSKGWLKSNYFGSQGLVCLCNPADVVAVPPLDDYGKLRTCAYLPIEKARFDNNGDVIPFEAHDGFDCGYVTRVIYEGLMGTEEDSPYKISVPEFLGSNREKVTDKLLDIALKCITERQV